MHANATAAWLAGCAAVNGTLGGIGERTGNEPIELAAVELAGIDPGCGLDLSALGVLPAALALAGAPVAPRRPVIGADAFLTRAGVHIDGLLKDPEIYLPFDARPRRPHGRRGPERPLGRGRRGLGAGARQARPGGRGGRGHGSRRSSPAGAPPTSPPPRCARSRASGYAAAAAARRAAHTQLRPPRLAA